MSYGSRFYIASPAYATLLSDFGTTPVREETYSDMNFSTAIFWKARSNSSSWKLENVVRYLRCFLLPMTQDGLSSFSGLVEKSYATRRQNLFAVPIRLPQDQKIRTSKCSKYRWRLSVSQRVDDATIAPVDTSGSRGVPTRNSCLPLSFPPSFSSFRSIPQELLVRRG
ncbi:hypothetical protein PUN28_014785 [Cardiocondyla obscurior]|uniref:Uncharacterized protein n=1 Tax=Cardiocondyla obscurior TaxID=286306 RepID=A0AAW2EWM6_9HYME